MRIPRADKLDFAGFCRNATDRQIVGIYEKEKKTKRRPFARIAKAEATRRGINVADTYSIIKE